MDDLSQKETAIANNEASLLGLLLREPKIFLEVGDQIRPEMFHFPGNQILYKAIAEIHQESINFDITNLINYLVNQKQMDKIGAFNMEGANYLNFLTQNAGFSSEKKRYVKNIIDQYKTDNLNKIVQNLNNTMDTKPFDISELISNLQLQLINLDISEIDTTFKLIGDEARQIFDSIQNKTKNEVGVGLKFGFPPLDEVLLGSNPGDLIILAARPAMGKTAFALNIANNVAKAGKTVLFFSLEMSNAQLVQRMMSIHSIIPISTLRKGELTVDDQNQLYWTMTQMIDWKMFLNDKATLTISDIMTISKRFNSNRKVDLLIIDYLQLIGDASKSGGENRQLEVAKISRGLKQLARELGCPIIALSQLSRNVEKREDKTPIISDLRESGQIEQDADAIIFLYRKDYYNKKKDAVSSEINNAMSIDNIVMQNSLTNVIVAKNRHGSSETIPMLFQPACNRFFYDEKKIEKEKQKLFVPREEE